MLRRSRGAAGGRWDPEKRQTEPSKPAGHRFLRSRSEPLFFSGCRPHLEQDRLIFNDTYLEFYGFENGIWEIK